MPTRSATSVSSRLSVTRSRIALIAALLVCCASTAHAAGATGLLNDTGQTQCDNGSNVMAACTIGNTGDAATYKRQDGRFGRDPAAPAKVGGGVAGFDFSKVCFNGDLQGAGTCTGSLVANTTAAATGAPTTDWACTKDNVTNLIWSLQSGNGDWTTYASTTLPTATNAASRCGFATGWRLPTRRELLGIVLNDGSNPSVDASYFPSTQSNWYWTSDTYAPSPSGAWVVVFDSGYTFAGVKTSSNYVRLVRSGQ